MLRKLKWQIPGEPLAARYNRCQGPVQGRGPAVEKHCLRRLGGRFEEEKYHLSIPGFDSQTLEPVAQSLHQLLRPLQAVETIIYNLCSLGKTEWHFYDLFGQCFPVNGFRTRSSTHSVSLTVIPILPVKQLPRMPL